MHYYSTQNQSNLSYEKCKKTLRTEIKRASANNRYTYAFWAITRYTAQYTLEKASWRRLGIGLRSNVPTNGSKDQGTPTINIS